MGGDAAAAAICRVLGILLPRSVSSSDDELYLLDDFFAVPKESSSGRIRFTLGGLSTTSSSSSMSIFWRATTEVIFSPHPWHGAEHNARACIIG